MPDILYVFERHTVFGQHFKHIFGDSGEAHRAHVLYAKSALTNRITFVVGEFRDGRSAATRMINMKTGEIYVAA